MKTPNLAEILSIDDIPGPKGELLLGNIRQLKKNKLHQILESWADEFGSIYKIRLGKEPIIVLSDTDLIQEILSRRPKDFRRRKIMEEAAQSMGINGIFTTDGELWKRQRKLTVQAFDSRHLENFCPILTEITDRLKRRWLESLKQGQDIDVQKDMKLFTIDIMSNMIFGYDINCLETEKSQILTHLNQIFPIFHSRINSSFFAYWKHFKLPADYKLERSLQAVRQIFLEIIAQSRQRLTANPKLTKSPKNLVEGMLSEASDPEISFSDEDIFANAFSVWLAGEDAVANTLAWTIYFLLENPQVQAQIQAEIDGLLSPKSQFRTIKTMSQANQMPYIEAVLLESMRLKPVAPMISVQANRKIELSGLSLPKSAILLLLPRVNTLNDEYFAQADKFKPERWLDRKKCPHAHQESASMPFGSGSRYCAGSNLAMLDMKMAIAMIGQNFHLKKSNQSQQVNETYAFLMEPEKFMVQLSDHPT